MKSLPVLRVRRFLVIAALVAATLPTTTASAQAPQSLELVPADVAYYSASLRLREQYDAFVASKAFAKLKDMPVVQMGWQMFQQQWNDPAGDFAQFKAMYEQPANQQLVELLIDAFSHEVFSYGDQGIADVLLLLNEINSANQQAQFAALSGGDPTEAMLQGMLEVLNKHLDGAALPDVVIGFRISDKDRALAQLARLEQLAGALDQNPALQGRFARKAIGGGDCLTLQLDGSLIPWDQIPEDVLSEAEGLQDKVSKMTLAIALGLKDDFLILSVGDSTEHLSSLGQGEVLGGRKELAPLKQHLQKPITSVAYVSEEFMTKASSTSQQIDQFTGTVEQFLPLAGLDADLNEELVTDIKALGEEIKSSVPRVGAASGFNFRTERGFEGLTYNWGENKTFDDSKPLTILNHVGGDPLLVIAARGKYSPESYDSVSKWCGKVLHYVEKIALAKLGEEEREFFDKVRGDLEPLVKQLDQVTREKLIPAFKDGQTAVVFDAKSKSEQLHIAMPATDEPLPIPELALVYGVSDAGALKEAAQSYFQIAQKVIDVLHKAEPTEIPDLQLPPPESRDFPGGTIYYYRLPQQAGLDKQIAPNAGLSDKTLVLSLVPKMTVRLIDETPLQAEGPLADTQKPLAAAFHCNFAGILAAIEPWVDYALTVSGADVGTDVTAQIKTGFEIGKCFRGISGVTYQEGDAWVSHYEAHFQDLP